MTTTTKNGTDVAALRDEVAALRAELAQLRVDLAGEVRTRSLVVVDEHGEERITTMISERQTALMISSGDLPDRARFGCPNEASVLLRAGTSHDAPEQASRLRSNAPRATTATRFPSSRRSCPRTQAR